MSRDVKSPLRVLVFFATNNIGGPGKGLFQLIEHTDPGDIGFTVCNFRHPQQETFEFLEAARERGVDIKLIVQKWALDPSMVRQAVDIAREGEFDLIQSHGYKTHILAWITSRRLGLPWVALSHGWTAENIKIHVYNAIERFCLRRADSAVGVAPALFAEAQRLRRGKRTRMILNAIEDKPAPAAETRDEIRAGLGVAADSTLIGVFGRLSFEKGQDLFIEALGKSRNRDKLVAIVLGEGNALSRLQEQARALGLDEAVRFLGYKEGIERYYAAIDLCVLPSRSEGLPNVVLEAQLAGVPVVAFDVGGVSETIADGETGWLVRSGDTTGLAAAVDNAIESPTRAKDIAKAAKSRLFPKFSITRRCESFADEYRFLVSDNQPAGA